jgi:hypothetical protein
VWLDVTHLINNHSFYNSIMWLGFMYLILIQRLAKSVSRLQWPLHSFWAYFVFEYDTRLLWCVTKWVQVVVSLWNRVGDGIAYVFGRALFIQFWISAVYYISICTWKYCSCRLIEATCKYLLLLSVSCGFEEAAWIIQFLDSTATCMCISHVVWNLGHICENLV